MKNEIDYTDGDIEKFIEHKLSEEKDLSSNMNICSELYDNWPIRYHLSSIRGNQIRHLNFSGLNVLEFGGGMGAMSRVLAENCKHLTVIEGTEQRLNCLKQRLRDLSNWDAYKGNFQDFKTTKKYDVVCLFGVFEYSGKYINQDDPFLWTLKFVKKFLNKDGVLLISIENKNGAKYFQGISEDHYGVPYYGICGYPNVNDVKTFSKKELQSMLESVGFTSIDIHHLAPDYKCTQAVLTDEFIAKYPIQAAEIQSNYQFEDYLKKTFCNYPQKLFLNSIAKSGLLSEFSNSYLFISSIDDNSRIKEKLLDNIRKKNEIAFLYTYGRVNDVRTVFFKKDEKCFTKKEFISDSISESIYIKNKFVVEKLIEGNTLSFVFKNLLYYKKYNEFYNLLINFLEYSFDNYKTENISLLKPCAFDSIARNVIQDRDKFITFDNEYEINFILTKDYFLFRVILDLWDSRYYLKDSEFKNLHDIYIKVSEYFGIERNLQENIDKECKVQSEICRTAVQKEDLLQIINCPFSNLNEHNSLYSDSSELKLKSKFKIFGLPIFVAIRNRILKISLFGIFNYEVSLDTVNK